jgi:hypothetical protein
MDKSILQEFSIGSCIFDFIAIPGIDVATPTF